MRKRFFFFTLFPAVLLFCQCATGTPEPAAGPSVTPLSGTAQDSLETIRRELSLSSPASLGRALDLLEGTPEGSSEAGQELGALAGFLFRTVYPLAAGDRVLPGPPVNSPWNEIFRSVAEGKFPRLSQESVTFFTTLISPVSLLFSDSPQVWVQCEEALSQLRILNPQSVLPVYLQGLLAEKRKNYPQALESYRAAVGMDSSCYPAETGTARIQIRMGKPAEAVSILETQAAAFPDSPDILRSLGEAYLQNGDSERALTVVTDALLILPDDTALLFLRARILEKLGRLDQARRILSIVERTLPNDPDVLLLKARLAAGAGDRNQAVQILARALELNPGRQDLRNAYGELLLQVGDGQAGREILNSQLESDPESLPSLEILLKDAVASGSWEKAGEYSTRILDQRRDLADLVTAREIALALNQSSRAEALADEMYQRFPSNPQAEMIRIQSLIRRNDPAAARDLIRQALVKETRFARRSTLYYLLSLTLTDENDKIEALRSALLEDLENRDALVELARIYTARKDIRNAVRYMKQAALLAPDDLEIRKKLEDLEKQLP